MSTESRGRLYISNLPIDLKADELGALIKKVCPVVEVYIPPKTSTGIHRLVAHRTYSS